MDESSRVRGRQPAVMSPDRAWWGGRLARPVIVVVILVTCVLGLWSAPASAHVGGMGVTPSDYSTTVKGLQPPIPGMQFQVYEGGNWVVLTNHTPHDAVVLGYLGEPYLRVGPSGSFENTASPSLALGQALPGDGLAPDPGASSVPVHWSKLGDGPSIGWHDHRVHWALTTSPPEVQRSPGVTHLVIPDWQIPIRWNNHVVVISGNVVWSPGSSAWPWIGGVLVLATVIAALGWPSRRSRVTAMAAITLGLVADLIWAVDRWSASYVPIGNRLDALFAVFGAALFGSSALWLMRRPGPGRGMVAAVFTGVFLLGDVLPQNGVWRSSDVPTNLTAGIVRVLTLVVASCGLALLVVGWHQAVWIPGHPTPTDEPSDPPSEHPDPPVREVRSSVPTQASQ